MKQLRLIADDLTGALDAAAQFVTSTRPIPVFFGGRLPAVLPASFAVDAGTREKNAADATSVSRGYAELLGGSPDLIAFKKVDSLLRGHPVLELAATLEVMKPAHCVIAPAFPFHGRITRGGIQYSVSEGLLQEVGENLVRSLKSHGIAFQRRRPGDFVPKGVSLWDAQTDTDLREIVGSCARLSESVLWCGSGGLAAALVGTEVPAAAKLERPILGLFGSDHPATVAQVNACGDHAVVIRGDAPPLVSNRLSQHGVCLASVDISAGTERPIASGIISRAFLELALDLPPPRSLIVSGGETLRAFCLALDTDRLELVGQFMPGIPVSVMIGGRWNGTRVASKSGSFGDPMLLRRIVSLDERP